MQAYSDHCAPVSGGSWAPPASSSCCCPPPTSSRWLHAKPSTLLLPPARLSPCARRSPVGHALASNRGAKPGAQFDAVAPGPLQSRVATITYRNRTCACRPCAATTAGPRGARRRVPPLCGPNPQGPRRNPGLKRPRAANPRDHLRQTPPPTTALPFYICR